MKKGLFFLLLLVILLSLAACSSQDKPTLMYFRSGT
jgi:predicted small lipoprotein YifL